MENNEILTKQLKLAGEPLMSVSSFDIPIQNGKPIDTALAWIEKNPIGIVATEIGNVEVTKGGIKNSFGHTNYKNKVTVLPAIKPILERGVYIGNAPDWNGNQIQNYYFAAPIKLDKKRKIVFIRIREKGGYPKLLYVHEVFTEDEIKKAENLNSTLQKIGDWMQTVDPTQGRINASDLYRSILNNILSVK
jgi:hypothetical protein